MSSNPPRIAIIGGGPAGLTLLNVLGRHGVKATLYEWDESEATRVHLGGMLDLHADTGQLAIRGAGLWDAFQKYARSEGEELIVTDRTGVPLMHHRPTPSNTLARPEIDRHDLRRILIEGAPAGSIVWGHMFVSANKVEGTDEWELHFANGDKTVVDLLIGADGGRSRVRPLVSSAEIEYTGYQIVETYINSSAHPELTARVGAGSHFAFDEHKFLAAQHNGDGRVRVYCFFRAPASYVLPSDPEEAIAEVLAHIEGWADWMREMVRSADRDAIHPRALYVLPVPHTWPHRKGVTLVGDSMSLMSTFAAKGANIAMWAALQLGEEIGKSGANSVDAIDEAVARYEKHATLVAGEAAALSAKGMETCLLQDNGARRFIEKFEQLTEAK
ncbi:tetracycline resistance protein [Exidia glandulosa HHB12029]|uniref:Tetracycline resistance protein n=1 Tax=Exidia glandulosa HHB12029 TaxID=1314781 RepID=A0A166BRW7_EXIGL|nr:tetracycline resistance protein [Exidia glandulosa HHB12029]